MESIVILLVFALFLLYIAFYKKDSTLIIFSGILFVLGGLDMFINQFQTIKYPLGIATVTLFIGIYLMVRTGIEMIADKETN